MTNKHTRIYAFSNQKGGVGKTTTAVSVSAGLAQKGFKCLLIDLDPQGNATSGVGIDKRTQEKTIYDCLHGASLIEAIIKTEFENLSLIPSNTALSAAEIELTVAHEREFLLKNLLSDLDERFDFILIDCPPSLGLLTVNALVSAHKLIIPLQCEYYSLEGLGDLLNTFSLIQQKLNPSLEIGGVVLAMADFRANSTIQVIEEIQNHFEDKVFRSIVSRSIRVSEAPSHGKPIIHYDPASKGAVAYLEIVDEILEREGLVKKEALAEKRLGTSGQGEELQEQESIFKEEIIKETKSQMPEEVS